MTPIEIFAWSFIYMGMVAGAAAVCIVLAAIFYNKE